MYLMNMVIGYANLEKSNQINYNKIVTYVGNLSIFKQKNLLIN